MDLFTYRDGSLHAEDAPVAEIVSRHATPTYIYSASTIRVHYQRLREAFAPLGASLRYAVKANNNPAILRLLLGLGAGLDVVSGGELERAWSVGCPMDRVVFAGVGKSEAELMAALSGEHSLLHDRWRELGLPDPSGRGPVGMLNVESAGELELLAGLASRLGVRPRVAIRLNPDIDARTHTFTTTGRKSDKFGVPAGVALELFRRFGRSDAVELVGLHAHLGSPIYDPEVFAAGAGALCALADRVLETTGVQITHLDLGGGIGADYESGQTPPFHVYAEALAPVLGDRVARGLRVVIEPGRSIVGNAGILVTRVQHVKEAGDRAVVVCDAGMNCLIRPALYGAFHFAWPVEPGPGLVPDARSRHPSGPGFGADDLVVTDLVGPICESSDFLARGWTMPRVVPGDLVAVFTAGAYARSMASTYNDHPLGAEVLVEGSGERVIRSRQHHADLLALG
ncbi:MAG: diaminopimelate decarboxylase family protein [Phycisphaerales bacterium JB040]